MPHDSIPRLLRVILGKSEYALWQVRISFFQSKLGLICKFFPSVAQKSQTVLQPSDSGQSVSFGLLQERISWLVPPSAGRMLQTTAKMSLHYNISAFKAERLQKLKCCPFLKHPIVQGKLWQFCFETGSQTFVFFSHVLSLSKFCTWL